ncbi:DUF2769 domain-containing protein [Methanotrichaceae archaeon M04Ac]|jgi:hypothetical protein|uniref:DUF2769 domain-containing protein n=1 Tax=Candidatus Methanocrinis alkalitolerans TaxID=3033395 RepID=A0ABT5XEI5_9EURY|nr:DUF2769 domain-containing protein [Candidatus Methanocrinis alkalitolerans]MDF0593124.1 DUF2769 domain-containing protein [Candidatus Methanocrinis alkalitolerans]
MEMDRAEMEKRKQMVLDMCTCKSCPSFVECGEEGGFCFVTIGKSGCISEEKGCICGGCPVYEKMGLSKMYYCLRGSEKEQT